MSQAVVHGVAWSERACAHGAMGDTDTVHHRPDRFGSHTKGHGSHHDVANAVRAVGGGCNLPWNDDVAARQPQRQGRQPWTCGIRSWRYALGL